MGLVIFCRHASIVALLTRELEHQRSETMHERNRAEVAIAELLLVKTGSSALMPNLVSAVTEEEKKLDDLLSNPEFSLAGTIE